MNTMTKKNLFGNSSWQLKNDSKTFTSDSVNFQIHKSFSFHVPKSGQQSRTSAASVDALLAKMAQAAEQLAAQLALPVESNKTSILLSNLESSFDENFEEGHSAEHTRIDNDCRMHTSVPKRKRGLGKDDYVTWKLMFESQQAKESTAQHDFCLILPKDCNINKISLKSGGEARGVFHKTDYLALIREARLLCQSRQTRKSRSQAQFIRFETFQNNISTNKILRQISKNSEQDAADCDDKKIFSFSKPELGNMLKSPQEFKQPVRTETANPWSRTTFQKEAISQATAPTRGPKSAANMADCDCYFSKHYNKGR